MTYCIILNQASIVTIYTCIMVIHYCSTISCSFVIFKGTCYQLLLYLGQGLSSHLTIIILSCFGEQFIMDVGFWWIISWFWIFIIQIMIFQPFFMTSIIDYVKWHTRLSHILKKFLCANTQTSYSFCSYSLGKTLINFLIVKLL